MSEPSARQRLDIPRTSRFRLTPRVDVEAVGQFSESIARFLGTGKYLLIQTVIVVIWIAFNLIAISLQFDPYPFILLNLFFSTQASYSAPLILLAQNRQDDRDRVQIEQDRQRAERNLADTEYLAREVVALRMAMTDVSEHAVTRDVLRQELYALLEELTPEPQPSEPESAADAPGAHESPRPRRITTALAPMGW